MEIVSTPPKPEQSEGLRPCQAETNLLSDKRKNMEISTSTGILASVSIGDWVLVFSTGVLAITAFVAPYILEKWKHYFYSAKMEFKFFHTPPYCHKTEMRRSDVRFPVYYFRFKVRNKGKTEAERCEVVLERIWKRDSEGSFNELTGFSPVPLKWSGTLNEKYFTIQPDREVFCDIGRIHQPTHEPLSVYQGVTSEEERLNKFFFELPERYYAQQDYLVPGTYRIEISIYSKNARKISKKFEISWSGIWKDQESNMLNELIISLGG